ncbi:SRPBCC domain-containing protein [Micromonospora sp. NPDC005305]|uniref:SRPBCC domain-containing protein n=1 Tax=Micromonospora sp. NPDC005305 TaxID=3156875 RepID=UPI0033A9A173
MIEIATEVDLFHPPGRIWRALTEQALLAKWFAGSESLGDRTLLRTGGLPGYDADTEVEVVELRAPERLVLRCREGDRSTRLACDLAPLGHGSRLSVREVLEEGDWDADRRAEQHQRAVTGRLPAILDWLAFQEVDLRRAEGGLTAELPVVRPDEGRGRTRRRLVLLVAGVLAVLGVAAGATVWATRPAPRTPAALPASTPASPLARPSTSSAPPRATPSRPTPSATRRSVAPSATAGTSPTRTASPSARPAARLAASYETVSDRVFGYRGQVVVSNPGPAAKPDWTVTVTLGDDATVSSVNGAEAKQDGAVVTFTGAAVPAGGSTTIRFDVRDPDLAANEPEGCTVDGAACAGL